MNDMEKVIRDGLVAVVYSPGFGAGWYTWNSDHRQLLFHPKIVEKVEDGTNDEIDEEWVLKNLGLPDIYCGGARKLKISWLPVGTAFTINEYDGSESVETIDSLSITA